MPLQWCVCPVCGAGFSGMSPGAPCSSKCSGRQRQAETLGKPQPTAEPKFAGGKGKHEGKGRGGSTQARGKRAAVPEPKGGNCLVMAVALAAGASGLLGAAGYAAARLTGVI